MLGVCLNFFSFFLIKRNGEKNNSVTFYLTIIMSDTDEEREKWRLMVKAAILAYWANVRGFSCTTMKTGKDFWSIFFFHHCLPTSDEDFKKYLLNIDPGYWRILRNLLYIARMYRCGNLLRTRTWQRCVASRFICKYVWHLIRKLYSIKYVWQLQNINQLQSISVYRHPNDGRKVRKKIPRWIFAR